MRHYRAIIIDPVLGAASPGQVHGGTVGNDNTRNVATMLNHRF